MLTITDIKNINFRKVNLGGYRPEDVDEFIDEVIVSYDQLLKDNAGLTKQMEELTQKIEAYRADEDNIRAALMNAQKLGEASIRESKHKSDIILKDAAVKSERIVTNAQREVAKQEEMVDSLKRQISNFKSRLMLIYREHMNLIEALPETDESDEEMERSRPIERKTPMLDVMDEPSEDLYDTDDEGEVEEVASFPRSSFIMPDMDDEEESDEEEETVEKSMPRSNIEEVVNPFNSFLSGQKFPASPVSFGDKEPEDAKPGKGAPSKPRGRAQDKERVQDKEHAQNREGTRPNRDARRPERPKKEIPPADAPRNGIFNEEDESALRPPRRRDRGNRRSMAMDMADREADDLEMPAVVKRDAKPPRGAQIPAPKDTRSPAPKPPRDEDESRFGKLKFGPDYENEEDDGEEIPMGMFRRRR